MKPYVIRVVGQSGVERYLWHGKAMWSIDNAQKFAHASRALSALRRYLAIYTNMTGDVIDTRDPERQV